MQYMGIDPGKSGSISLLDDETNRIVCCKLSETEADIWNWMNDEINTLHAVATIEKVHAMPARRVNGSNVAGQGVSSAFTFGKSYGFLLGVLTAIQIPYKLVTPQQWQKGMQCLTGGDKNVSKAAAQRLWPTIKITHAIADSLLIAEYGRTNLWL